MLLNLSPIFDTVNDLCAIRNQCLYYCETDNFPMLTCKKKQIEIVFHGNRYKEFFFYPHPEDNNQIATANSNNAELKQIS